MANNISQTAFLPAGKAVTVNLGVTAASQQLLFQTGIFSRHCRVYNASANDVFIEFGETGITAALATGIPVKAGTTQIFSAAHQFVAAIAAVAGPSTVYFTPGEGGLS